MKNIISWKQELQNVARPEKIKILSGFFKTYKGGYGEGDIFIGITVPENRKIAKQYYELALSDIEQMLQSEIHEFRLSALLCLIQKYEKSDFNKKEEIVNFYLLHTATINNWDLVDLSAPKIIGNYMLWNDNSSILQNLSRSNNMWEQRIAIVSTYTMIKNNQFDSTIDIAKIYLTHKHDLIHKATGWMLREIGKRDIKRLFDFLDTYARIMPRTTLRYAIERLDSETRNYYMKMPNNR
ncbi:MAG: DNA alkylation repair protein [Muribaculaceae bacterium]